MSTRNHMDIWRLLVMIRILRSWLEEVLDRDHVLSHLVSCRAIQKRLESLVGGWRQVTVTCDASPLYCSFLLAKIPQNLPTETLIGKHLRKAQVNTPRIQSLAIRRTLAAATVWQRARRSMCKPLRSNGISRVCLMTSYINGWFLR